MDTEKTIKYPCPKCKERAGEPTEIEIHGSQMIEYNECQSCGHKWERLLM